MQTRHLWRFAIAGLLSLGLASTAFASSHREAPFTQAHPTIDGTDFYMFMAYGNTSPGEVVFLANYNPLQSPFGGPNYFPLNPNALYAIHIDNNGDAKPDITFQFHFKKNFKQLAVPVGNSMTNPVPLINTGPITASDQSKLNRTMTYTVNMISGNPRSGKSQSIMNPNGGDTFTKPVDNIGQKSLPNYMNYAKQYMYTINVPGCDTPGKVFVGQRSDGFVVNLGEVFDLVNTDPVGPMNGTQNVLAGKNVTTIALEVPAKCLTTDSDHPVIGAWTTASIRQAAVINPKPSNENDAAIHGGAWTQVSRLGMPLVNELVIGLPDKNKWNGSYPADDAQFLNYVTNPTLPVLLHVLFGKAAVVPGTPRHDLVHVFLTGLKGLNQPANVTPAAEMRLNTSIEPTTVAKQSNLGVLGKDLAGFPNGRRPGDDTVDVTLRVAEGALCGSYGNCGDMTSDPNGGKPYTDGATHDATDFLTRFPYLNPPIPGSPNSARRMATQKHDNNNQDGD
jgi:hypothetical protein